MYNEKEVAKQNKMKIIILAVFLLLISLGFLLGKKPATLMGIPVDKIDSIK